MGFYGDSGGGSNLPIYTQTWAIMINTDSINWACTMLNQNSLVGTAINDLSLLNNDTLLNITTFSELAGSTSAMTIIANNELAMMFITVSPVALSYIMGNSSAVTALLNYDKSMNIIISSELAMTALVNSSAAMKVVASGPVIIRRISNDPIALNLMVNSQVAMKEIAASTMAMTEILSNEVALPSFLNSQVAMKEIAASAIAMQKVAQSSVTVLTKVATNPVAMKEIAASSVAMKEIAANQVARGQMTSNSAALNAFASSPILVTSTYTMPHTTSAILRAGTVFILQASLSGSTTMVAQAHLTNILLPQAQFNFAANNNLQSVNRFASAIAGYQGYNTGSFSLTVKYIVC